MWLIVKTKPLVVFSTFISKFCSNTAYISRNFAAFCFNNHTNCNSLYQALVSGLLLGRISANQFAAQTLLHTIYAKTKSASPWLCFYFRRRHLRRRIRKKLQPHFEKPVNKLTPSPYLTEKNLTRRWTALDNADSQQELLDPHTQSQIQAYEKNIEHFVGTVKVPVGVSGPLRVNGLFATGDYLVPLATTEAALVASYNRGSKLITACGGASAMLLNEGVTRTPGFAFKD